MNKLKILNKGTVKSKELGITLIALVVTIVVLLILAAISIQMLTGNNGILQRAGEAKVATEKASAKEQIQVEVLGSLDTYGNPNAEKLKSALTSLGAEVKGTTLPFFVTLDGHDFTISKDGTTYDIGKNDMNIAKLKVEIAEIEAKIKTAADNGDEEAVETAKTDKLSYYQGFYGKTVNYEPKATIQTSTSVANTPKKAQWKIFYTDENNIYLIADSYVTYDSMPKDLNTDGSVKYSFLQSDANNLYKTRFATNGSNGIFQKYTEGSTDINSFSKAYAVKLLNKDFFYYKCPTAGVNEGLTGTGYNSMKAVSSMLDTEFWDKKYKDNNEYAEYTIGGPTIEMLFASYNQTHGVNFGAKAYKAGEINASGETIAKADGYKISRNKDVDRTDSDWVYTIGSMLSSDITKSENSLYVSENNQTNADAYWLASPSSYKDYGGNGFLMQVKKNGDVSIYHYTSTNVAFRPIICLKSNVQLVEASQAKKDQGIDFELR